MTPPGVVALAVGLLVGVAVAVARAGPGPGRLRGRSGPGAGGAAGAVPLRAPGIADMADRAAAALDAGLPLAQAWAVARGAGAGGARATDPPVAAADDRSRMALAAVGAALRLCAATGVPAAGVLRAAALSVRDRVDAEDGRRAAVSGAVTGAWIVAGLPVAGPLLGAALGIDTVAVLTGTSWGRACGTAGLVFLLAGGWWSRRLVARARSAAAAG